MLKKAGIIAGVVTAGVLGVSAVAFAGPSTESVESENLTNECSASQTGPQIDQNLLGGSSLAGLVDPVTGAVAPITTQAQAANCTNVGVFDVIDSGSGNETTTGTRTEIDDSYNTVVED